MSLWVKSYMYTQLHGIILYVYVLMYIFTHVMCMVRIKHVSHTPQSDIRYFGWAMDCLGALVALLEYSGLEHHN